MHNASPYAYNTMIHGMMFTIDVLDSKIVLNS